MLDFVRLRKWCYLLTAVLMVVTVVALVAPPRIPWGLEFSSGTSLTIDFEDPEADIQSDAVLDRLVALGLEGAVIQETGDNGFFIRTAVVEDDLIPFLEDVFGPVEVITYDGVADLAEVISFVDPVPEGALRDAFGEDVEGFVSSKAQGGVFISAQGVSDARLQDMLATIEERYGTVETTSFDAEGDMALVLDFGPEVSTEDFEDALSEIDESFQFVESGLNAYTVVSPNVSQETRDRLLPALRERFGLARQTTFGGEEDFATLLTSKAAIDSIGLRNELDFQGFSHVDAIPAGENAFLLVAENVPEDRQEELLTALRDRFEGATPERFDFAVGLAMTLDFGITAEFANIETEVTRLNPNAFVVLIQDDTYFVGATEVLAEDRDSLVSGLEDVFGLVDRTSFDFSTGVAFTMIFTDPVTLDDLIGSLVIIPVQEALSAGVEVRLAERGAFDLIGIRLPPENQERILADVESKIGPLEITRYDPESDLAVTLDFGAAVSLADLRMELGDREPTLEVEPIGGTTFFLGNSEFSEERLDALVATLELIFGPVRRATLNGPNDMAQIVVFDPPVTMTAVRDVVLDEGLEGVVVAIAGAASFFIGGQDIDQNDRDALLAALADIADTVQRRPYDFTAGVATTLDFGETVDEAALIAAIGEEGVSRVTVVPAGRRGFFLGGRGIDATAQEELLTALEDRFGLANRTLFNQDDDMALAIRSADPDAAADAVAETLIVQKLGPNSFFLAGDGVSLDNQELLFTAVQEAFGDIEQSGYNLSTNLAGTIHFAQPTQLITQSAVSRVLEDRGYTGLEMVDRGEDTYFLRGARPSADQKGKIINTLEAAFGSIDPESIEFSFVDAEIARRSVVNTFIAVAAGAVGILLYVWWAFRRAPRPFRFGVAAVIGLIHDVAIVMGAFGLMAKFRGVEIDSLMIIGLLAVIGYSVNNTIVVLDRIRENVSRNPGRDFESSVNFSLNETLSRNLNTTITTAVAILAVLLFGGGTIFDFMLVLLVGVLAGTYSSLFLAANLLVSWERGELPKLRLPSLRRREEAHR